MKRRAILAGLSSLGLATVTSLPTLAKDSGRLLSEEPNKREILFSTRGAAVAAMAQFSNHDADGGSPSRATGCLFQAHDAEQALWGFVGWSSRDSKRVYFMYPRFSRPLRVVRIHASPDKLLSVFENAPFGSFAWSDDSERRLVGACVYDLEAETSTVFRTHLSTIKYDYGREWGSWVQPSIRAAAGGYAAAAAHERSLVRAALKEAGVASHMLP